MGTIKWSHERSNKLSPPLHKKSALQSESTERRRRVDVLMMILDVSFNSRREWNVWGKLDCWYSPKDPHCERVFIPQHREPPACDTILNQNNFLFVIRALIPACFYSYLHLTTNMSLFFKKKKSKSHNYTSARSPLSNAKPKRVTKVRAQPGQQGALCQRQEVQGLHVTSQPSNFKASLRSKKQNHTVMSQYELITVISWVN